jgi:hypothetical protein
VTVPPYARWSAYGLAAVLTLAAIAWVGDDQTAAVVQPSSRTAAAGKARAGEGPQRLLSPAARQAEEPAGDPFAVIADGGDESARVAVRRALPEAAPAATAPALPFTYLGSWKENGKTVVFVRRDDRSYKIEGPGPLDPEYAVRSVDERRISLKYLPLGIVQELRLDASEPVASAVAAVPVQNSPEPETAEN